VNKCETCRLVERRNSADAPLWDSILRTRLFDVAHAYNTSLAGWIVVVAKRHVAAIHDLSEDEAAEVGALIRRVSLALRNVLGCSKTYVMQFAEQPGHCHVHFHVVPRMHDLPGESRGVNIFNCLGVEDERRVSEREMNHLAARLQRAMAALQGSSTN
jgi:diadenosine tetraphosphate (Ap4A) HIT family hydrolase